ncbi:MAG: rod shape-determining protein [Firmicutes bacterium]|nr:rod shape-determining protein [Bacillota bacterium]
MVFSAEIGIDLGTASILLYVRGQGIVVNEPAVVAVEQKMQRLLAVGSTAWNMLGRTPENIVALRPLRAGVIADFSLAEVMLRHFLEAAVKKRYILRPRVVVCIPAGTTPVEQKAVLEAVARIGARETFLIEEPRAAALGAQLNIFELSGSMIVDIGGGTSDIAVISMGEVVEGTSVRIGGDKFDEAVARFVKKEYNLLIGERTAEALKKAIGSAHPQGRNLETEVRGRDLITGLPRQIKVTTGELSAAFAEPLSAILDGIKGVLQRTPPELAGDIIDKGVVLSGGGALLDGFSRYLSQEIGIPFYLAEEPLNCVIRGTAAVLEKIARFKETLPSSRNMGVAF